MEANLISQWRYTLKQHYELMDIYMSNMEHENPEKQKITYAKTINVAKEMVDMLEKFAPK